MSKNTEKQPTRAGRTGFLENGRSINFYVGVDTVEKTVRVGGGNRSRGLRMILDAFDESMIEPRDVTEQTQDAGKPKRRVRPAVPSTQLGRPAMVKKGKAVNYTVGENHLEKAKRIGNGNQSEGVRIAVEAYDEGVQSDG